MTGFAKKPTQPPSFDAASAVKGMAAPWANFPALMRWMEAIDDQDGKGLRDVVNQHGYAIDSVKTEADSNASQLSDLSRRVAALEARPLTTPFPASS